MALFDNLDDFINGGNGFSLPDSPGNRNPVELDESSTESKISKSKVVQKEIKSAPAAKGRKKRGRTRADLQEPIEFEEKEETNEPQSEFCPVRGQKAAWKRLNKMRDDLAKQTEEVVEPIPKGKSNPKQKQKQNGTARKRRNQSRQERDIVDLISSPDLVLPGTINLDSDEELEHTKMTTRSKADQLQASFSSENTEIIIKVKYTSEIMEFPLRPYQKFSDLIEQMSNGNGFDCKNILLTFKDKIISHSSTPNSVGYTPGLIIFARELSSAEDYHNKPSKKSDNSIKLQVQSAKHKRPFEISIGKADSLKTIVFKCAEELKCSPDSIRLEFDGEPLDLKQTASDMEFEGGEMLDLFTK